MTILQQVLLAFAAFVLFIFAIRLVFALLLRLQLLPILVWLGVGRLYPQWAAAHPFVFYGVLALFALLAPPGGGVGTGTANAAAGRAADQK
mgnify:CR=1 FL=1